MTKHPSHAETVEDVLSSIRAIIENDIDVPAENATHLERHAGAHAGDLFFHAPAPDSTVLRAEDVFDLTEMLTAAGGRSMQPDAAAIAPAAQDTDDEAHATRLLNQLQTAPASLVEMAPYAQLAQEGADQIHDDSLLSPQAAATTAAAFASLKNATSAALSNADAQDTPTPAIGQLSVAHLVQLTLRPLLKEWLDAHLPTLVKKIVAEEVQKMRQGH